VIECESSFLSNEPEVANAPQEDGSEAGLSMSLLSHLSELGGRLKKALIAYIIALIVVSSIPDPFQPFGGQYSFYGYNFFLMTLIRDAEAIYAPGISFFVQSPTDPIFAFFNVSMVLALVVTLPYIFNQIYGFVAPGLYKRERRAVRKYVLPFGVLMTVGGVFGLVVIFPTVMRILFLFYKPLGVQNLVALDQFVNLLILIPLFTGLAFTFPVYIIPLVELKIISSMQLSKARKWVYVLVALAVGIANPDPTFITSIPIIIPIFILYEVTVYIAKRIDRKSLLKSEQLQQPASQ
jgi:sec-independent protein translocase protein TatC